VGVLNGLVAEERDNVVDDFRAAHEEIVAGVFDHDFGAVRKPVQNFRMPCFACSTLGLQRGEETLRRELSQTLPARLMLQVMPHSPSNRWNCSLL